MKSRAFAAWGMSALVAVAVAACGGSDDGADALPGSPAGSSGAGGGSAGAGGKAGAAAAGKAGNGGATAGKGGSAGTAGAAGKGGGAGTAGAAGKGGGAGTAGAAGKAGGGAGGAGGKAGAGGASAGASGASAGTGGATAGTGGATAGAGGATAGTGGASAGTGGASAGSGGASAGSGGASAGSGGASAGSGGATAGAGGASAGAAGTGGAGGAVGCVGTDTACTTSTNTQGLCRSGVCADCAEPADDGACGAAYGAGNVCLAAACGVCDAVGTTYVVDPVNGDDALATGSGTSGGAAAARCAFKTVTAAIAAIGGNAAGPALTISVVGPSTLDAGETYPLRVPRLVTVTTSGGDVIVKPTGDDRVFDLATDGATLDGGAHLLDIDATSLVGNNTVGVLVTTGSTDATTLRRVRITGAPASCVAVGGTGRVTVKEGTHLTSCGRLSPRAAFTVGDGAAFASFVAAAGEAPIHIEQSPTGLAVIGSAAVKLSGVPDPVTVGQGTILIEKCAGSGVLITQSATSVGGPPLCELDGVVSFANGGGIGGSGLRATWTSNVKLRNSAMLGNTGHGVHLIAPNGGAGTLRVDLGTAGDPGHNTLQRTNAQGNINLGVGVCFSPANRTNLTIPARGNIFGPNDCASSTATLSRLANGPNACSGGRDTGVDATPASNSIDVATCQ